jgi:hypothetical protein
METTRKLTAVYPTTTPVWAVMADVWGVYADCAEGIPVRILPVEAFGLIEEPGRPATRAVAMIEPDDALCCLHEAEFQGLPVSLAGPRLLGRDLIAADATLCDRHGEILLEMVTECPHPENYLAQALAAVDRAGHR